jgi:hypothetical protein
LVSLTYNAPLEGPANPNVTPNPSKAPWYFMGFQELILHFHPTLAVVVLPLTIIFLLFYMPGIRGVKPVQGVWFLSERGKYVSVIASIAAAVFTFIFVVLDEYILPASGIFKHGILSFILLAIFIVSGFFLLKRKYSLDNAEIVQAIGVYIFTGFVILTFIGFYLRGEGMKLIF